MHDSTEGQYHLSDFSLQSGVVLTNAFIGYRTYGTLNSERNNVIVFPTWYTGNHDQVAPYIGSGKALDPDKYFIVIPDMFTNGASTSPSNAEAPCQGLNFPLVTPFDNVAAQRKLLEDNFEDTWFIFYLRGICYERSDNWDKAEKDFIESLKLKRNSPDVLNYLAYGWIERDMKIDESFVMLTDAYNANPDSYYILDSLAWVYYKKKDYKKAAELMEEVIDMVPGEAISLDHLGDIYYAMNRKREASFFWKQAKDLPSPEDEIIEKIEKKLKEYNAT